MIRIEAFFCSSILSLLPIAPVDKYSRPFQLDDDGCEHGSSSLITPSMAETPLPELALRSMLRHIFRYQRHFLLPL